MYSNSGLTNINKKLKLRGLHEPEFHDHDEIPPCIWNVKYYYVKYSRVQHLLSNLARPLLFFFACALGRWLNRD